MIQPNHKKRPRVANNRHPNSTNSSAVADALQEAESESSQKIQRTSTHSSPPHPPSFPSISFGDLSTSDVILDIFSESDKHDTVRIYLHSGALQRSLYFSALLSNRWQPNNDTNKTDPLSLKLPICPSNGTLQNYLTVLDLLYVDDFDFRIDSASFALDILPAAVHLLFEDLIRSCVKFLEAVPWTEEEETRVLEIIPCLNGVESEELLARLSPRSPSYSEEMLQGLISQAIHNYPNTASSAKAFVAKLLKEVSSRESAKKVLEKAFGESLKMLTESLEEYSSPDCRGSHNETEAKQRVSLHRMLTNGRHMSWLVERMVELRVADKAVKEWSEQPGFTADLQKAFQDDACRNVVPGLPAVLLRCTCKIANAVASGTVLAARQVRMKLVKDWLPVLTVCKDNVSSMLPGPKSLYLELEETFLKIISTLPMSDALELLQQCLGFSTRNVEDCPHLMTAFNTWFRRAARPPGGDHHRIL